MNRNDKNVLTVEMMSIESEIISNSEQLINLFDLYLKNLEHSSSTNNQDIMKQELNIILIVREIVRLEQQQHIQKLEHLIIIISEMHQDHDFTNDNMTFLSVSSFPYANGFEINGKSFREEIGNKVKIEYDNQLNLQHDIYLYITLEDGSVGILMKEQKPFDTWERIKKLDILIIS